MAKDFDKIAVEYRTARWKHNIGKALMGVVSIILGILFIAHPGEALEGIAKVAGALAIIAGCGIMLAFFLFKSDAADSFTGGVISILIGILLFRNPGIVIDIFPFVTGVFVFLNGVDDLGRTIILARNREESTKAAWIISAVLIVLGLLLMFHPGFVETQISLVAGIIFILDGAADLFLFFKTH